MRAVARDPWRILAVLALGLAACASTPRAPSSTCMQRTVDDLRLDGLSHDRQHCLASGAIARRCGAASAWLAGYGKEIGDLFGPGRFQRRDLVANAAGRECGKAVADEAGLAECCASAGY